MRAIARSLALEGNIRVLAVQTLVSQLGFGMFYVVWQPYILSTGVGIVDLGIIQSTINLSTAAGLIVWGVLSDRFGRRPVMLFASASRLAALMALVISSNFVFLLAFSFFVGFSALFMMGNPARSALVSESVSRQRNATALSTLMAISQISLTLTSSIGGYLAMTAGYRIIFYVCIVGDLFGLVVMALFIEETLVKHAGEARAEQTLVRRLEALLMPEKKLAPLYLIMVEMGVGYGTAYSLFYGFLVESYGFTTLQLGLLSTVFNLTWALASIPLGRLSDRVGRKPMLVASWAMAVVTATGFLFARSFEMFLLFNLTNALDPAFWISPWLSLIAEKAPPRVRSTVMGKLDSYTKLVGIPAPWLGGVLYSTLGFSAPLIVHLAFLSISGVIIFSIKES
jgi:MFS family permease